MEQTIEPQLEWDQALGPWRMLRLARRWGQAPVRAAVFLRRPDDVEWAMEVSSGPLAPLASRFVLDDSLRADPNASTQALPAMQLLVLDQLGTLHLVGLKGWFLARLDRELMRWPVGEVAVTVRPGKDTFRPIEIAFEGGTLLLAGPWRNQHQRAALELIQSETGDSC
jgi:hypothetical protein